MRKFCEQYFLIPDNCPRQSFKGKRETQINHKDPALNKTISILSILCSHQTFNFVLFPLSLLTAWMLFENVGVWAAEPSQAKPSVLYG